MEIVGIALIILQVISLFGGLDIPQGGIGYMLSYCVGRFAIGIIGVILLVKGAKKRKAQEAQEQEQK